MSLTLTGLVWAAVMDCAGRCLSSATTSVRATVGEYGLI